jgi:protein-tyrosine phosphatase
MTVLFVCTGNICRSPLAERLASRWLGGLVPVGSAGTHAVDGRPMHPLSAAVLERHGGTADDFRSRLLTEQVVGKAALVLTMTEEHRDAVLRLSPRTLHSAFTLLEAATLLTDDRHSSFAGMALSERPAALARQLAEARALRGRRRTGPDDIDDPMGGSASTHDRIGAEVAAAVRSVTDALRGGAVEDAHTVRMRRLPPVPAGTHTARMR